MGHTTHPKAETAAAAQPGFSRALDFGWGQEGSTRARSWNEGSSSWTSEAKLYGTYLSLAGLSTVLLKCYEGLYGGRHQ